MVEQAPQPLRPAAKPGVIDATYRIDGINRFDLSIALA